MSWQLGDSFAEIGNNTEKGYSAVSNWIATLDGPYGGQVAMGSQETVGATATTYTMEADDIWIVGMHFRGSGVLDDSEFLSFMNGSNEVLTLTIAHVSDRIVFTVRLGDLTGTVLDTFALKAESADFQHLEFKVKIAQARSGYWEARVNGVQIARQENISTSGTGDLTVDTIRFTLTHDTGGEIAIANLFILNGNGTELNDFLGEQIIESKHPIADVVADWATLTGPDHFAMVDEPNAPDDDTSYIQADNPGSTDTFTFEPWSQIDGEATGFLIESYASLTSPGAKEYKEAINLGASSLGTLHSVITDASYVAKRHSFGENPYTNRPVTKDEYDGGSVGVEVVT